MAEREKLIWLLCNAHSKSCEASAFDGISYAEQLSMEADFLLANGITFAKDTNVPANPVIPGHDDQHNISEMSYKNGYAKGCEDTEKKYTAMKEELEFTRKFIHSQGLEFAIISEWNKATQSEPAAEEKRGHWISHNQGLNVWAECSECHVCGSPQWKVCPVCETKMEPIPMDDSCPGVKTITINNIKREVKSYGEEQ